MILVQGLFKRGSSDRPCRRCCSFRGYALYFGPVIFTWSKAPASCLPVCTCKEKWAGAEEASKKAQRERPVLPGWDSLGLLGGHSPGAAYSSSFGALQICHPAGTKGDCLSSGFPVCGWQGAGNYRGISLSPSYSLLGSSSEFILGRMNDEEVQHFPFFWVVVGTWKRASL